MCADKWVGLYVQIKGYVFKYTIGLCEHLNMQVSIWMTGTACTMYTEWGRGTAVGRGVNVRGNM